MVARGPGESLDPRSNREMFGDGEEVEKERVVGAIEITFPWGVGPCLRYKVVKYSAGLAWGDIQPRPLSVGMSRTRSSTGSSNNSRSIQLERVECA